VKSSRWQLAVSIWPVNCAGTGRRVLHENREMRAICQKLGFRIQTDLEEQTVKAELEVG
jgi:hypothetical protein